MRPSIIGRITHRARRSVRTSVRACPFDREGSQHQQSVVGKMWKRYVFSVERTIELKINGSTLIKNEAKIAS